MSKKKVLIIDDDEDTLEASKIVIESGGFSAICATNIKDALEIIEKDLPDLIVTDVMLNKMCDGFDFARKLKSSDKYKNIPILMITAIGSKTGFQFSDDAGDERWLPVNAYMEKPVLPSKLISKVKELLSEKVA